MINIINSIESFFNSHYQVAEFGFGNTADISNIDRNFPIVWLEPVNSTILEYQINYNFNLYAFTLFEQDKENIEDSLNDTQQILIDFISYFKLNRNDNYWLDIEELNLTPYEATLDDFCNGWQLNINFIHTYDSQTCYLPVEPIPVVLDPITVYVSQTSSSAYTWYNVLVRASGGTGVYVSGTGTTVKQYGTYSFTVTDNSGNTGTTSYKVEAPIPTGDMYYFAFESQTGSTGHTILGGGHLIMEASATRRTYINWGDGTDELKVGSNSVINHTYANPGFYPIDFFTITSTGNTVVPAAQIQLIAGCLNMSYFKNHLKPISTYIIYQSLQTAGDLADVKKPNDNIYNEFRLHHYTSYVSSVYGDIANLKYYQTLNFYAGPSNSFIYGDIREIIEQDYTGTTAALSIDIQYVLNAVCTEANTGSTFLKNIKRVYLASTFLSDVECENVLIATAHNQQYSGGIISTAGTNGKVNYTKPSVLAAKNYLLSKGWTVSMLAY